MECTWYVWYERSIFDLLMQGDIFCNKMLSTCVENNQIHQHEKTKECRNGSRLLEVYYEFDNFSSQYLSLKKKKKNESPEEEYEQPPEFVKLCYHQKHQEDRNYCVFEEANINLSLPWICKWNLCYKKWC